MICFTFFCSTAEVYQDKLNLFAALSFSQTRERGPFCQYLVHQIAFVHVFVWQSEGTEENWIQKRELQQLQVGTYSTY